MLPLRLGFCEHQRPHRAHLDTQGTSLSADAQIAFEIPVFGRIVENGAVRAAIGAGSTPCARVVVNGRDPIVAERYCIDRTSCHTLRQVAVPTDRDVELIPGHVLGNGQAGQAEAALTLVI
jgi:hypothetical protein